MEKEQIDQAFKNLEDSNFGDVMVVGGGISGIQASLDLADSGYKVYLVRCEFSLPNWSRSAGILISKY